MRRDRSEKDFYTQKAKKENYPARSIYKLQEINEKFRLIKKGDKVLDLGSAPGSWLSYVSRQTGKAGLAVGVDLEEIKIPWAGNIVFIKKNIFDLEETDFKEKFNAIISDAAPKTSGIKPMDAAKSLELAEKALAIAEKVLLLNGNFICKIFESEFSEEFFKKAKKRFTFAKKFKPKAVLKQSREFYIIGKGFEK